MSVGKLFLAAVALASLPLSAVASNTADLHKGSPDLKSAGAMTFSPQGILFVGDSKGAAVFALDVQDEGQPSGKPLAVKGLDQKIAALLGTQVSEIRISDLAVHPASQRPYLSVTRGRGDAARPVLLRIDSDGTINEISLRNIAFAKASIADAPASDSKDRRGRSLRTQSITDMAFHDGTLWVAGLSNEEFASTLRRIPFPFEEATRSSSLEIFHAAHGRYETHAPIRTFLPFDLNGQPHILASYTCTPLVAFPTKNLVDGQHVKGKTVAELGAGNVPLDIISYKSRADGKTYLLLANNRRNIMKIDPGQIPSAASITDPVTEPYGTAGIDFVTLPGHGITQIDNLNENYIVFVQRDTDSGALNLSSMSKRR